MARRQRGSRQLSTRGVAPVFTESELAFLDDATDSDASHSSKSECAGGIPHDAADLIACRQYATVFVLATMGIFLMLLTPLVAQFPMFGLLLLPFTLFVHDWIVLHSSKLTRRFIPIINVKSMLAASSAQNPAFHEFFANSSFENRVYNCCLYGPEINPDIPRTADEISPPSSESTNGERETPESELKKNEEKVIPSKTS